MHCASVGEEEGEEVGVGVGVGEGVGVGTTVEACFGAFVMVGDLLYDAYLKVLDDTYSTIHVLPAHGDFDC